MANAQRRNLLSLAAPGQSSDCSPRGRRSTVCAVARSTPHNRPSAAYDHSRGRPAARADSRNATAARYRNSAPTLDTAEANRASP